jgi:Ca2+-binding EF-hand superfamily protein
MFTSFDGDRDGKIDASELGRALAHYKYASLPTFWFFSLLRSSLSLEVGPPILNLLMNKYGESNGRFTNTHQSSETSDNRDYPPTKPVSRLSSSLSNGN